jgi:hypothetical protein
MTDKPDLSHIRLCISTPCDGHNLDMFYVSSLSSTVSLLRECGAHVDWYTSPGCADLPLARAKLFGKFYRSDLTHMMMIDSDQGWNPWDIVRLIQADREYVGAAGPKKGHPIIFAANNATEDGDIMPVEMEMNTGIIKCTEVGAAFMLMSKSCAEKMVNSYESSLSWDSGKDENGNVIMEYAIYDPMIFVTPKGKRMRWSEDFSFCKRWRAIGGEIFLCPEIKLKHTGSYTWEAAQVENFVEQDSKRQTKLQGGGNLEAAE